MRRRDREFIGGAYSNYKVKAGPPWIRLVVTPKQVEFHARGLARLFSRGPWLISREQVRQVFMKRTHSFFPPRDADVVFVTTDPSVWWTFWSPSRPEPLLLLLDEYGYAVDWTPHNWAGLPIE
ncbi:hypothetical protein [Sinomonas humi]|uniref:Uncharacterized protein n=1 Tax=Sinomonas humi TaxID=1338436 RepID=A0A0B2AFY1_9MICC|nr:hypothetical protein [Sinomonas humi]KHL02424.1 hypothetical protein LK10_12545 [Sinomonas humi]